MIQRLRSINEVANYLETPRNLGVEQWLAWRVSDGFRFIKWIRIVQEPGARAQEWCLYLKESLDVGSETFIDIDEFEEIGDPDAPEGQRHVFDSAPLALSLAAELGAEDDQFVVTGGIQYMYQEFYLEHGAPEKGIRQWFST